MRYLSFDLDSTPRWGYLTDAETVVDCSDVAETLLAYLQTEPALRPPLPDAATAMTQDLARVSVLAPITNPVRNVFAVGANYRAHVDESDQSQEEPWAPIFFTKATSTVAGPGTLCIDPGLTAAVDWEIELAVVIGTRGRNTPEASVVDHIFGFAVANDISARDVQHGRPENQWFLGKSLDGFCPMGPVLVTPDEIADLDGLELRLFVDGQLEQHGVVGEMIFSVTRIVSELSRYIELLPGDIILTGTPGGVGGARKPPRFLRDGETMTAEISGLGTLTTQVRMK